MNCAKKKEKVKGWPPTWVKVQKLSGYPATSALGGNLTKQTNFTFGVSWISTDYLRQCMQIAS